MFEHRTRMARKCRDCTWIGTFMLVTFSRWLDFIYLFIYVFSMLDRLAWDAATIYTGVCVFVLYCGTYGSDMAWQPVYVLYLDRVRDLEGSCFRRGTLRNFIQSMRREHSLNEMALSIIGVAVIIDPYLLHHFIRRVIMSLDTEIRLRWCVCVYIYIYIYI